MDSDKEIDRRRVAAAKRFLAAVDRYKRDGKRDGRFICDKYLAKFDDKDCERAKVAIKIAEATSENINSFGSGLVELSSKVSLSMMSSEGKVLSATVDSMGAMFDHLNGYLGDVTARVTKRDGSASPIRTNEELDAKLAAIKSRAEQTMELTIFVAELASEIGESRCDTLREFR